MANILLDYFFPITSIEPTPDAATGFLKNALLVVKPKEGVSSGTSSVCSSISQVGALTADTDDAAQLFAGGMASIHVLAIDDLDLEDFISEHDNEFFTIIVSSQFADEEVSGLGSVDAYASLKVQDILYTAKAIGEDGNDISIEYIEDAASGNQAIVSVDGDAITVDIDAAATTAETIAAAIVASSPANALVSVAVDEGDEEDIQAVFSEANLEGGTNAVTGAISVGDFKGVVAVASDDEDFLGVQAGIQNRVAFYKSGTNKAKNLCFAFGKLLSNPSQWRNQQYIQMPFEDDVDTLGEANALFDDKVSFVLTDDQFGNRLGLFAAGQKAIVAPYIKRNLEIDMQSAALQFISANQPQYTLKAAALLEDELKSVIDLYIRRQWIEAGTVEVLLENNNFVATGNINISEPSALWRIFGELQQTL